MALTNNQLSISNLHGGCNVRRNSTLICVPIKNDSVDQMLVQIRKAKDKNADLVELRLDFLKHFNPNHDLELLIKNSCLPTLVTFRPTWEGGQYDGDESKRQSALCKAMQLGADYVDVELKVAEEFFETIKERKSTKTAIVVSSHNYECTPSLEEIGNLVARIQATGADIVKIVTTATDITDCAPILQLLTHSQVPTIGFAMGEKGLISRVLCAKFGGFLTYASLDHGAAAPDQPTIETLLDLYNFRYIGLDTKVFGVIGNPIAHSKSPLIFNAAFKSAGFDGLYLHLLVDNVSNFFKTFSFPDFAGYSIGIPHKMAGLECCDEVDPIAKEVGAINCLVRRPSVGKLAGYNFDYIGAMEAIEQVLLQVSGSISPLRGKIFVVIGAGGAGKALAYGGSAKGARVVIANRTFGSAADLATKIGGKAISLDDLENFAPEEGMILANTTSVGMKPNTDETPISKKALKNYDVVFDAVYTPKVTRLLREAQELGAIVVYGTEMLLNQAFKQYEHFTGLPAPKELMREVLSKST